MALISCPECGHQVSDQAAACPSCGFQLNATAGSGVKAEQVEAVKKEIKNLRRSQAAVAGEELGEGIAGGLLWLAGNRFMALVWVWILGVFGMFQLGGLFGVTDETVSMSDYGKFGVAAMIVPVVAVVLLRKPIQKIVPPVLTAVVGLGMGALYLAFVGGLIYVAGRMLFG